MQRSSSKIYHWYPAIALLALISYFACKARLLLHENRQIEEKLLSYVSDDEDDVERLIRIVRFSLLRSQVDAVTLKEFNKICSRIHAMEHVNYLSIAAQLRDIQRILNGFSTEGKQFLHIPVLPDSCVPLEHEYDQYLYSRHIMMNKWLNAILEKDVRGCSFVVDHFGFHQEYDALDKKYRLYFGSFVQVDPGIYINGVFSKDGNFSFNTSQPGIQRVEIVRPHYDFQLLDVTYDTMHYEFLSKIHIRS